MRHVCVGIVGVGGVGKEVLRQLHFIQKANRNVKLALICRSTKSLFLPHDEIQHGCIDAASWEQQLSSSTQPVLRPFDILQYLKRCPGRAILIDNTSDHEVAYMYPDALANGVSIVTPNKKAFSDSIAHWNDIFGLAHCSSQLQNGHIFHEATVGAGLPIISTLKDLVDTGDRIKRIEGVFSGTMSFLFNSFAPLGGGGGQWSEEVIKAKQAGYTEPDPRDDLNGLDVARKLVILARVAGLPIEDTSSFPVQSLVPQALEACQTGDEFVQKLSQHDAEMEDIKSQAIRDGKVIRFVGSIDFETKKLKVGLESLDKSHPIAGLKGSDNIVNFYTERYSGSPLVIQGAGAGGAVTAMGVISDTLKVLRLLS